MHIGFVLIEQIKWLDLVPRSFCLPSSVVGISGTSAIYDNQGSFALRSGTGLGTRPCMTPSRPSRTTCFVSLQNWETSSYQNCLFSTADSDLLLCRLNNIFLWGVPGHFFKCKMSGFFFCDGQPGVWQHFLNLKAQQHPLEGFLNRRPPYSIPRHSDSAGPGWGLRICVSNKFPGGKDAEAALWEPLTFENKFLMTFPYLWVFWWSFSMPWFSPAKNRIIPPTTCSYLIQEYYG